MIDFFSTRKGVPPEARACLRLLAACVAQAIDDASAKPYQFRPGNDDGGIDNTANLRGKHRPSTVAAELDRTARSAIEYLFGEMSDFEKHADFLGFDADAMRISLLSGTPSRFVKEWFSEERRRMIRYRARAFGVDLSDPKYATRKTRAKFSAIATSI